MHGADTLTLSVWKVWWKRTGSAELCSLLRAWDPIGVAGEPPDEYDSYAPRLAGALRRGASTSEVLAYLTHVRDQIGVDPDEDRDRDTAVTIVDWYRASTSAFVEPGSSPT